MQFGNIFPKKVINNHLVSNAGYKLDSQAIFAAIKCICKVGNVDRALAVANNLGKINDITFATLGESLVLASTVFY